MRQLERDVSYIDDGAKKLYEERMKRYREEREQEEEADDVEFTENFRLPGYVYDNLFDYQRTGVKWLYELHLQQTGGIVGDEMGLGLLLLTHQVKPCRLWPSWQA